MTLRDYAVHKPECEANMRCCRHPLCVEWRHDKASVYYTHEFEPKPCTCGLQAALDADGWEPIDSAPKDGTEILLTDGHYKAHGLVGEARRRVVD